MRSVWLAIWSGVRLKVTVVGPLTPFHCAAGKVFTGEPTAKVTGPHDALRESDGWRTLNVWPLRNSVGLPSQLPMRHSAATLSGSAPSVRGLKVVVAPLVTV